MSTEPASPPQALEKPPHLFRFPTVFLVLGAIWPVATVVFEVVTRACAQSFFDPLPTVWHLALALSVPAANGLVWWIGNGPPARYMKWISLVRGAAWVSGVVYLLALNLISLVAIPMAVLIVPLAFREPLVAILPAMSLGPLMGFLMLARSGFALRQVSLVADDSAEFLRSHRGMRWAGACLAMIAWAVAEARTVMTASLAERAQEESVSRAEIALSLRRFGDKEALREICREGEMGLHRSGPLWSIVRGGFALAPSSSGAFRFQTEIAREIFFRAYGEAHDSRPARSRERALFPLDESPVGRRNDGTMGFAWDEQRGSDGIGPKIKGLTMHSSRMDWHVDEPSRLAYGEWTIEFKNMQSNAQEARCQMLLPPRGVVSRLTLWIDGEEREAAFGAKAQVKAAYRQVVQVERRDPVMVNMIGPDLVMTQCFPVPPAGTMKIRLGIIAPLEPGTSVSLLMPRVVARNFLVPGNLAHALWVQSASAFKTSAGHQSARSAGGASIWQGSADHEAMQSLAISWPEMQPAPAVVWTEDPFAAEGAKHLVRERLPPSDGAKAGIILVVDTSLTMAGWRDDIGAALARAPGGFQSVVLTDENEAGFIELKSQEAAAALGRQMFQGGMDNAPALHRACEIAAASQADTRIVWLHGPQPLEFSSSSLLEQFLERSPRVPEIRTIQLVHGRDVLLEKLYQHASVSSARLGASLTGDELVSFIQSDHGAGTGVFSYSHGATAPDTAASAKVWPHLARYAAYEKVLAGFKGTARTSKELADLAAKYQIVTPVSSAVVLETQAQYDRAGLKPVDPSTTPKIPAVPEPGIAWLLMLSLALATFARRRSRG